MKKHLQYKLLFLLVFTLFYYSSKAQTPTANFTLDVGYKSSGCGSLYVKFKNTSTNADSYEWDFGDGSTKQPLTNPTHPYDAPGTYTVILKAKNKTSGLTNTKTETAFIRVYKNPVAEFKADNKIGCINYTAQFSDSSKIGDGKITAWEWFFGDANGSSQTNPPNTFKTAGSFNVTLKVTDENKCTSLITKPNFITTIAKPVVTFSSNEHYFCPPLPNTINVCYTFTGTAISPTFKWDFGNGVTSTDAAPCNSYPLTKGTYDVKLIVSSQNVCVDSATISKYVEVNSFKADFRVDYPAGCAPHSPTFTDLSASESGTDNAIKWDWLFSNGKTSDKKNGVNVSFDNAGKYDVRLITTSQKNCVDTIIKNSLITVYPSPNIGFTVDKPEQCKAPATITFTDTTNGAVKWAWDFGVKTTALDVATILKPSYIYSDTGLYDVKLVVVDSNNCVSTLTKTNLVRITKPRIGFKSIGNKFNGCKDLDINFLDTSISKRPIVKWEWVFGDGQTNTTTGSVINTYKDTGEFNVYLKVTDNAGCTDSLLKPKYIQVGEPQSVGFTAIDTIGCHKLKVTFTDTSNAYLGGKFIDKWMWDYGLGFATLTKGGKHVYTYNGDSGWFDVSLKVEQNGCESDVFINDSLVYVVPPVPRFSIDSTISCKYPYNANFLNKSILAKQTIWDFGDGTPRDTTTTEDSINHIYKIPYFYDVTIYVSNDTIDNGNGLGCWDTLTLKNIVKISDITPNFIQNKTHICQNQSILYTDKSLALLDSTKKALTTIKTRKWIFGDGFTITNGDTTLQQTHTFTKFNVNKTTLIVTDDLGCRDTIIKINNDTVFKLPQAKYYAPITYGCEPLTVLFYDKSNPSNDKFNADTTIVKWLWDFGELAISNDTSKKQDTKWTYKSRGQNGYYDVKLTVTDKRNCSHDTIIPKYVTPSYPYTKFDLLTPICRYNAVKITDATTALTPVTYLWDFGDGTTSTSKTPPTHYYSVEKTDSFLVVLTVTDTSKCDSSFKKWIVVSHPVADFQAFPPSFNCPPALAKFTNTATATDSIQWNFGLDSTTYIPTVQKDTAKWSYTEAGSYNVKLVTTNTLGCRDTVVKPKYININGPKGSFTYDPISGCAPLTVKIKATAEKTKTFTWRFSPEGTDTITTVDSIYHTFTMGGKNKVNLILSDPTIPCSADAIKPIDEITVVSIVPGFSMEGDSSCSPDNLISLTDTSEITPSTEKTNVRYWDLGNTKFALQDTSYKYDTAGTYRVIYHIQASNCPEKVDTQYVYIFKAPQGSLSFNPNKGCNPLTVNLKATAINTVNYKWTFTPDEGTNTTTTTDNLTHVFNTPGINRVQLMLSDPNVPCDNYATIGNDTITVISFTPNYKITGDSACTPTGTVTLTDLSTITPSSVKPDVRSWDLGNGTTVSDSTLKFAYNTAGVYTVKFKEQVSDCPVYSKEQTLHIFKQPVFGFALSDSLGCTPFTTTLTVYDELVTDPVKNWIWTFGDNTKNDSNKTVIHTYYTDSIAPIQLKAIMQNNCIYTTEKKVGFGVYKAPTAKIFVNFDSAYAQHPVMFVDSSTGEVAKRTWTFGDDAESTEFNPQHAYKYIGKYIVTLFVESSHQCKDTIQKTIDVVSRPYIPNAFTPDNDGFNDVFMPYVQLKILNRWGEVLYEGTEGWDGFYKNTLATSGTYYYIITINDVMNKEPKVFTGPVTLIKK